MPDPTWGTVAQAVVLAACTWYMRRGSVKDKRELKGKIVEIKAATSTPDDVTKVREELAKLRADLAIFKVAFFKQNPLNGEGPLPEKGKENA